MSKHTPGPWTIEKNPPHTGEVDPELPPYWFIEKFDGNGNGFHIAAFLSEPDAKLISAAPELLQVLEDAEYYAGHQERACVGDGPCVCGYEDWWTRFQAAIAKAKGQS